MLSPSIGHLRSARRAVPDALLVLEPLRLRRVRLVVAVAYPGVSGTALRASAVDLAAARLGHKHAGHLLLTPTQTLDARVSDRSSPRIDAEGGIDARLASRRLM